MKHFLLVLCLSSLMISTAHGEPVQLDDRRAITAEKVAMAAFDASQKPDWQRYAELVHPVALREFQGIRAPPIDAAQEKDQEEHAVLLAYFDGATDLKAVRAWKPKEFFVRFMMKADPPTRRDDLTTTAEVLGTILEGPDQAHVVVRILQRRKNLETSKVAVVTLMQSGGEWKVMPSEWAEMAGSIERRLSGQGNKSIEGKPRPSSLDK